MKMKLTHNIIMAAGEDAANKRMRKTNRKKWNLADWNCACKVTKPLFKILEKEKN